MALLFAAEGAKLMITDIHHDGVYEVVKTIHDSGGIVLGTTADVSKEEDMNKVMDTVVHEYGGIDVLINNAGIMDDFVPVAEVTNELWERVMRVNLYGPMYACRLAVPLMLQRGGGNIINISSIGGLHGARAGAAYTSSKHALIGLTKNIAYQYGDKNIRCNAIAPGGVKTGIGDHMKPHPLGYAKIALGMNTNIRMGEPEEIAQIALFLAGGKSSLMNGATLVADAGWTAY
jgi:NAD(P)-dependent dehydrogenase (short-subunit alcohol dehydrogenase family)